MKLSAWLLMQGCSLLCPATCRDPPKMCNSRSQHCWLNIHHLDGLCREAHGAPLLTGQQLSQPPATQQQGTAREWRSCFLQTFFRTSVSPIHYPAERVCPHNQHIFGHASPDVLGCRHQGQHEAAAGSSKVKSHCMLCSNGCLHLQLRHSSRSRVTAESQDIHSRNGRNTTQVCVCCSISTQGAHDAVHAASWRGRTVGNCSKHWMGGLLRAGAGNCYI